MDVPRLPLFSSKKVSSSEGQEPVMPSKSEEIESEISSLYASILSIPSPKPPSYEATANNMPSVDWTYATMTTGERRAEWTPFEDFTVAECCDVHFAAMYLIYLNDYDLFQVGVSSDNFDLWKPCCNDAIWLCGCTVCRLRLRYRKVQTTIEDALRAQEEVILLGGITPLQYWEQEFEVCDNVDWTTHWGWDLVVGLHGYVGSDKTRSKWEAVISMHFKDLLQQELISWKKKHRRAEHEKMGLMRPTRTWLRQSTWFPAKRRHRNWVAEIVMRHANEKWLRGLDLRDVLTPESVWCATIDRRTGPGRCKRVMTYEWDVSYGNDLMNQPVELWRDGLAELFTSFIRPFMPPKRS